MSDSPKDQGTSLNASSPVSMPLEEERSFPTMDAAIADLTHPLVPHYMARVGVLEAALREIERVCTDGREPGISRLQSVRIARAALEGGPERADG